jgi:predicted HAD superfamily Cof-like phosphohydrolase
MYNDVKTFIEACDQERTISNTILYHNLIKEEHGEYLDAIADTDELDACMDMIWVILGYCYMKGFDVDGAWKEVARSNLAKINPETGKVTKNEHGKVMKPDGWTPPVLEPYIK